MFNLNFVDQNEEINLKNSEFQNSQDLSKFTQFFIADNQNLKIFFLNYKFPKTKIKASHLLHSKADDLWIAVICCLFRFYDQFNLSDWFGLMKQRVQQIKDYDLNIIIY